MGALSEPLTVVSPRSVEIWYGHFARASSPVLFVGESEEDEDRIAQQIERQSDGRPVRILSGHDSLLRDSSIARTLRDQGLEVAAQSDAAVAAGVDKLIQKRVLESAQIPIPAWTTDRAILPDANVLRKGRMSTQSRDVAWDVSDTATDSYWEAYVQGTEYSVVIYRDRTGTVAFPPVWKGETRTDLLPPWRRLRTVPSGLDPGQTSAMLDRGRAIADLFDIWGFAEIELIVPFDGDPLVIEINPRICGTLRLVAMATRIPVFDWCAFPADRYGAPPAVLFAAELPFDGGPSVAADVIATSRITCCAATADAARKLLLERTDSARILDVVWPEGWT